MRGTVLMLAFCSVAGLSTAALAQSGATRSVDDYLCSFAGKCGEDAKADVAADDSIEAPDTKGMALARRKTTAPATTTATPSRTTAAPSRATAPSRQASRTPARTQRAANNSTARVKATQGRRLDLRLTFLKDSAELTPQAKDEAKVFARSLLMPELSGKRFLIEGHTDASGSREHNLELSRRRAAAVVNYLTSLGVPRSRLDIRGYGPDQPIDGRTASSPENRRVEALLL